MKKKTTKQDIPEFKVKIDSARDLTPRIAFKSDEEAVSNAKCERCLFVVHRKYIKEMVSINPSNMLEVHYRDGRKPKEEPFRQLSQNCYLCDVFRYFATKPDQGQMLIPNPLEKPKQEDFVQKKWHTKYRQFFYDHAPDGEEYDYVRGNFEVNLKVKSIKVIECDLEENEKDSLDSIEYEELRSINHPYETIFKFWKHIYIAYHTTIAKDKEIPKTPIDILSTKKRRETLDSLLHYPELLKNKPIRVDKNGKRRGNISQELKEYVGKDNKNLEGFEMYERVMKFLLLLVEQTEKLHEKDKYKLASDFLYGFLGISLSPEQIKEAYRERLFLFNQSH